MISKRYFSVLIVLVALMGLSVTIPAFAAENDRPQMMNRSERGDDNRGLARGQGQAMRPVVVGTVSSVSGNTITVSGRKGFGTSTAAVVYTVDATNAKIMKGNATSTVSSISVGDVIIVQGTLSGTSVTATVIRDGMMPGKRGDNENGRPGLGLITGNGQPVIEGKVSAISGATLTLTNNSNVQYTVDASSAKIVQGQSTSTLSAIAVGDTVIVQGTVNGSSVTASTVIDHKLPAVKITGNEEKKGGQGFFGGIGSFFAHLFGF